MAANVKCSISSLDSGVTLEAHFNPREISIDKQVPWNEQKTSKGDAPKLEFTDAAPAILQVELLFDTFESGGNVHGEYISKLESMAKIIDPESADDEKKRPHKCMFKWGAFPPFKGVIENLGVKYTMFFGDGTPCRATATLKMKEYREPKVPAQGAGPGTAQGQSVGEGDARRADRFGADHRAALDAHGSEDGTLSPGTPVPGRG